MNTYKTPRDLMREARSKAVGGDVLGDVQLADDMERAIYRAADGTVHLADAVPSRYPGSADVVPAVWLDAAEYGPGQWFMAEDSDQLADVLGISSDQVADIFAGYERPALSIAADPVGDAVRDALSAYGRDDAVDAIDTRAALSDAMHVAWTAAGSPITGSSDATAALRVAVHCFAAWHREHAV